MMSLAIVLCLSFGAIAMAKKNTDVLKDEVEMRFTHIGFASAPLEILEGGRANCEASIGAYSSVKKVKIVGKLQYHDNGWKTVKTWSIEKSGQNCSQIESCNVTKGYRYRFVADHYAYAGIFPETTSRTVYYDYY